MDGGATDTISFIFPSAIFPFLLNLFFSFFFLLLLLARPVTTARQREHFRSSFRAVLEQFYSNIAAVSVQSSLRAVSEQF